MGTNHQRIFISHSWEDKQVATRLERDLKATNIEVWVDHSNIRAGHDLPSRVSDALEWCTTLLLVWSRAASESRWVKLEWESALALNKRIVPCLQDHTELPAILAGKAYISFIKNIDAGLAKLIEDLSKGPRIESKEKTTSSLIRDYLNYLHKETSLFESLGFSIFALPITLDPGNHKMDGVKTISDISSRRILIHGKPASGKSTSIKRILSTAKDHGKLIPIELHHRDLSDFQKIQDKACAKLGSVSKDVFNALAKDERFLFIFDGLNEFPNIKELAKDLYELSTSLRTSKFLVTCRSFEFKSEAQPELRGFKALKIKDLDRGDQIKFIQEKVKGNTRKVKLLKVFKENTLLNEVCSNQFIFLMAMRLIPDAKVSPRVSSEFYELFLDQFLKSWEQKSIWQSSSLDEKRRFLEAIAFKITESGRISKTVISTSALERALANTEDLHVTDSGRILKELLHDGFLERQNKDIKFFQETFQEFLLASWLVRKGVFPRELTRSERGSLRYKNVEISKLSENFYLEMTGIQNFGKA